MSNFIETSLLIIDLGGISKLSGPATNSTLCPPSLGSHFTVSPTLIFTTS